MLALLREAGFESAKKVGTDFMPFHLLRMGFYEAKSAGRAVVEGPLSRPRSQEE